MIGRASDQTIICVVQAMSTFLKSQCRALAKLCLGIFLSQTPVIMFYSGSALWQQVLLRICVQTIFLKIPTLVVVLPIDHQISCTLMT